MPRGGGAGGGGAGRGSKKSHKGQRRHFTNEESLKNASEKAQKERQWRRERGLASESESEEEEETGAIGRTAERAAPGDLPPSDSEETDSEDESDRHKGVSHLIEIENPNRMKATNKKISEVSADIKVQLSRREREEIEKQQAKDHYQKMHMEGKTEEARADMARLALIRKQREEASNKRKDEQKVRDEEQAKAEKKLLEKKKSGKQ